MVDLFSMTNSYVNKAKRHAEQLTEIMDDYPYFVQCPRGVYAAIFRFLLGLNARRWVKPFERLLLSAIAYVNPCVNFRPVWRHLRYAINARLLSLCPVLALCLKQGEPSTDSVTQLHLNYASVTTLTILKTQLFSWLTAFSSTPRMIQ